MSSCFLLGFLCSLFFFLTVQKDWGHNIWPFASFFSLGSCFSRNCGSSRRVRLSLPPSSVFSGAGLCIAECKEIFIQQEAVPVNPRESSVLMFSFYSLTLLLCSVRYGFACLDLLFGLCLEAFGVRLVLASPPPSPPPPPPPPPLSSPPLSLAYAWKLSVFAWFLRPPHPPQSAKSSLYSLYFSLFLSLRPTLCSLHDYARL